MAKKKQKPAAVTGDGTAKRAAAARFPKAAIVPGGVKAAEAFFDLAEGPDGYGLRQAIAQQNNNIILLAKSFGYEFDYDDLQDHLIQRWGVTKKPTMTPRFCCT
jgi:hypothetical protein